LQRIEPYQYQIGKYASLNSLERPLVEAVIWTESSGFADQKTYEGNGVWCYGLMQVGIAAATDVGFVGAEALLLAPDINLRYGCAYLGMWLRKAGWNKKLALSSYNGGYRAYYYYQDTGTFMNPSYVNKVMGYYDILKGR